MLLRKAHPDTQFTIDAGGTVTRLVMKTIPDFTSHDMIDEIGTVTGETATVFRWEDDKQDFIRKTTNIKKDDGRSEEHTSELQSLMRNSYAVFCLKKKNKTQQ